MQRDDEQSGRVEASDPGEEARGRLGVEPFGGFVEQQQVGTTQQALGNAEAAALPARERRAARSDRGVQAGRKRCDSLVECRGGEHAVDIWLTGPRIGEQQVVPDGPVEDVGVLRD